MTRKILIIEDNRDLSDLLAVYFQSLGYEVSQAMNSAEGVTKALSERPNLIITDLCLPDVTGIETAAILKQNPITSGIPIIALTALPFALWKEKALKAGVAACLSKPVSPAKLAEVAATLVAKTSVSTPYKLQQNNTLRSLT